VPLEEKPVMETVLETSRDMLSALFGGKPPIFRDLKSTRILSIRPLDILYSDEDGAYFRDGAEVGELAIVSAVQAAFDGMRLTVRERDSDGLIKPLETDTQENDLAVAVSGQLETAQ